jgi:hypothetical protein
MSRRRVSPFPDGCEKGARRYAPARQGSFSLIGNEVSSLYLGMGNREELPLAGPKFSVNFCKVFACNI